MAEGSDTYKGLAVPLNGNFEITGQVAAADIATITGAASQTGDYLVCQNQNGTEVFYINSSGDLGGAVEMTSTLTVAAGFTLTAGDATITAGDVVITSGYYLRFGGTLPTTAPVTGLTLGDVFVMVTSTYHQIAICDDSTQNTLRYVNTTSV